MSSTKKKKNHRAKKAPPLPKNIRDELRMSCALRGYSDLKCGKSRRITQQYEAMYEFYHGKPPHKPSQIHMLASANLNYADLYDEVNIPALNKDDETATIKNSSLNKY